MKKFLIIFLLFPFFVNSQILDIEKDRLKDDTLSKGFHGKISLSSQLLKTNVNNFSNITNNIGLQYKNKKNKYLFWNSFSFMKLNDNDFDNKGFQHLRYNREYKKYTLEIFAQSQFNKSQLLNFRGLFGFGPRIKVLNKDKIILYIANLYMLEHENLINNPDRTNIRMSNYISVFINFNDIFSISNTTYYQPLLKEIGDKYKMFSEFRISSHTSSKIKISKKFFLSIDFDYFYNSNPPFLIKESYVFTNTLNYSF